MNRIVGKSFKKKTITQSPNLQSTTQRKSCECHECGGASKKMKYFSTVLSTFTPYYHIVSQFHEAQRKLIQQKQIKMRNKRHMMIKKAVRVIQIKDILSKGAHGQKSNLNIPQPENIISSNRSIKIKSQVTFDKIIDKPNPVPKRKWDKRITQLGPIRRRRISNFANVLPTIPIDPYVVLNIYKLINNESRPTRYQQGSKDDFDILLRISQGENPQQQEQAIQPQPAPVPTLQINPFSVQEFEASDEEPLTPSIRQIKSPIPPKHTYKDILKYNKRTFENTLQSCRLSQDKTLRKLTDLEYSHKITSLNVSPQQNYPQINYNVMKGFYTHRNLQKKHDNHGTKSNNNTHTNTKINHSNNRNMRLQPLNSSRKTSENHTYSSANKTLGLSLMKAKHQKTISQIVFKN